MNARCAYKPCSRIFHYDELAKRFPQRYCDSLCAGREKYRLRLERHGKPAPKARKPRTILTCQRTACGKPIPEDRQVTARYCSDKCRQRIKDLKIRHRKVPAFTVLVTATPPAADGYPVNPEAQPCKGCKWVRLQPAGERGVECAKDMYRTCNPLGFRGPTLKEAM